MLSTIPGFPHGKRVRGPFSVLAFGGQRFFPGVAATMNAVSVSGKLIAYYRCINVLLFWF